MKPHANPMIGTGKFIPREMFTGDDKDKGKFVMVFDDDANPFLMQELIGRIMADDKATLDDKKKMQLHICELQAAMTRKNMIDYITDELEAKDMEAEEAKKICYYLNGIYKTCVLRLAEKQSEIFKEYDLIKATSLVGKVNEEDDEAKKD